MQELWLSIGLPLAVYGLLRKTLRARKGNSNKIQIEFEPITKTNTTNNNDSITKRKVVARDLIKSSNITNNITVRTNGGVFIADTSYKPTQEDVKDTMKFAVIKGTKSNRDIIIKEFKKAS